MVKKLPKPSPEQNRQADRSLVSILGSIVDFSNSVIRNAENRYKRLIWPQTWEDRRAWANGLRRVVTPVAVLTTFQEEWNIHSRAGKSPSENAVRSVINTGIIYGAGVAGAFYGAKLAPKHPLIAGGAAMLGGIAGAAVGEEVARAADRFPWGGP